MKYTKNRWEYVGKPRFASGLLSHQTTHIAFDSYDNPYIVFTNNGLFVMKFNGNRWETILAKSDAFSSASSIAIDKNDILYAAYVSTKGKYSTRVLKYNKKEWLSLGEQDLTEIVNNNQNIDIAIDENQIPYIAFVELEPNSSEWKGVVKKYVDNQWISIGTLPKHMYGIRLAIDSKNNPFVSFQDGGNESKGSVMKYIDKEGWVYIGSRQFTDGKWAHEFTLALDKNDIPYVSYNVVNYPVYGITVMKFTNSGL